MNELHHSLQNLQKQPQAIGKAMNFIVMGKFQTCKDCAIGKAKQSNMRKQPVEQSKIDGERLFLDMSSSSTKSLDGSVTGFWFLMIAVTMHVFFEREK